MTVDSVGAMQPLQLCSTAQNVGTVNIGAATSQSLIPSFSTTLTTPLASLLSSIVPHITLPSLLQSYALQTCAFSNNTPSTSHNMQPKPGTVKSNQPFFIPVLNNRIKKCSGCSMLFRECRAGSEPDYILGHMERDWFPQNGQWQLGKLQNKYYHLQKSCILQCCSLYRFPQDLSSLTSKLDVAIPVSDKGIFSREFGLEI